MRAKLGLLLLLAVTVQSGWAGSKEAKQDDGLSGSYLVTITSPTNEFTPLRGTYSFIDGGVLIATDIGQLANPTSTAGQGAWREGSKHRVVIKWFNFAINPDGSSNGNAKLTGVLAVSRDGESFAGPAHFDAFDTDGNNVFSADEVLTGVRIHP